MQRLIDEYSKHATFITSSSAEELRSLEIPHQTQITVTVPHSDVAVALIQSIYRDKAPITSRPTLYLVGRLS